MFTDCPDFFQAFNGIILSKQYKHDRSGKFEFVVQESKQIGGNEYVENLAAAASKWRLAKQIRGLGFDQSGALSESLRESYSAQVSLAFSVVAFESFASVFHLRGKPAKWYELSELVLEKDVALAAKVRGTLKGRVDPKKPKTVYQSLLRASNNEMKDKLSRFIQGNNDDIVRVSVAFRNSLFHGSLGGYPSLIAISEELRDFILTGIQNYCSEAVLSCSDE